MTRQPKIFDPLKPPVSMLVKLGSIVVHADEYTSHDSHPFDMQAIRSLLEDGEVAAWLKAMDQMAMLPKKRKEPTP